MTARDDGGNTTAVKRRVLLRASETSPGLEAPRGGHGQKPIAPSGSQTSQGAPADPSATLARTGFNLLALTVLGYALLPAGFLLPRVRR